MTEDDKKELSNFIFPYINKCTLEEMIQEIKDIYYIFDQRLNPNILIRKNGNS
jgi:hypothetical protein